MFREVEPNHYPEQLAKILVRTAQVRCGRRILPGASLRLWGFDTTGYRTSADARAGLLAAVNEAAPWFDAGQFAPLMVASADAFDAVIAAMASRNAALDGSVGPAPEQLDRARREGWIALPVGPLGDLLG